MKQQFDGEQEKELPPTHRDEKFMFEMVRNIHVVFRKGVKEKNERERKMPQSRMCHLKINRFSLGIYSIGRNLRLIMSSILCIL
jgi:hypothetical protein